MKVEGRSAVKALGLCLAGSMLWTTAALASPYSVTYTGTISANAFPEVNAGESYTVELVVDNDGSSAATQTWSGTDVRCVIFTMNDAQDAQVRLGVTESLSTSGSLSTDGSGALASMFGSVVNSDVGTDYFETSGISTSSSISWYLNGGNNVFFSGGYSFGDSAWGVQMSTADWTDPVPFTGECPVVSSCPGAESDVTQAASSNMSIVADGGVGSALGCEDQGVELEPDSNALVTLQSTALRSWAQLDVDLSEIAPSCGLEVRIHQRLTNATGRVTPVYWFIRNQFTGQWETLRQSWLSVSMEGEWIDSSSTLSSASPYLTGSDTVELRAMLRNSGTSLEVDSVAVLDTCAP